MRNFSGPIQIWCEVAPFSDISQLLPDDITPSWRDTASEDPVTSAQSAQVILASSLIQYDGAFMDQLPNLRMIARTGIGVDNVNAAGATARNILVTNTPDGPTESTAEHAVALLLALAKRLKQGNDNLAEGKWGPRSGVLLGDQLQGKTLGLIGLGRIGRRVANICRLGLEMRVVGSDPFVTKDQAAGFGVEWARQEEVIQQADVLSIHAPSLPETYHMMNAETIATMKDGAYLINVARGPLVDSSALLVAVESGKLAGAGLDVFEPEPPSVDSALRNHPNIIATPHIAGVTKDSRTLMEKMAIERVLSFLDGKEPENVINPDVLGKLGLL